MQMKEYICKPCNYVHTCNSLLFLTKRVKSTEKVIHTLSNLIKIKSSIRSDKFYGNEFRAFPKLIRLLVVSPRSMFSVCLQLNNKMPYLMLLVG